MATASAACGVCSTAQDFGTFIVTYNALESETVVCATSYFFSKDFDELVTCFVEKGFTESCATLWAHFSATNAALCSTECLPDDTGMTLVNGSPPECEPQACLTCQAAFRADFEAISGFVYTKAGITERIAYDCDAFYRVTHDPCVAAGPAPPTVSPAPVAPPGVGTDEPVAAAPTEAPVPAPSSARSYALGCAGFLAGPIMAIMGIIAIAF